MASYKIVTGQAPQRPPRASHEWKFAGWSKLPDGTINEPEFSLVGYVIWWWEKDEECNETNHHFIISDQPCRRVYGKLISTDEGGLMSDMHNMTGVYQRLMHMYNRTPHLHALWTKIKKASDASVQVKITGRMKWVEYPIDQAESTFWGWDGMYSCPLVIIDDITFYPHKKSLIGHVVSEVKNMVRDLF